GGEMTQAAVRYLVYDVDEAIDFYQECLDFELDTYVGPGFASLQRDGLRLLLNMPGAGGGGQAGADEEENPRPGGWNRIQIRVDDLDSVIHRTEDQHVVIRGDVAEGPGGRQVVVEDPSGNPIEMFEAASALRLRRRASTRTRSFLSAYAGAEGLG